MSRLSRWLFGSAGIGAAIGVYVTRRNRIQYPSFHTYIIRPDMDLAITRRGDHDFELHWSTVSTPIAVHTSIRPDAVNWYRPTIQTSDGQLFIWIEIPPSRRPFIGRFYFEVEFDDGRRMVVAERIIPLKSVANLRDLGGYPTTDGRHVKWGMVYRSGALDNLTTMDYRYFHALGLRTICDLRDRLEVTQAPDNLPDDCLFNYMHIPLRTDDKRLTRMRMVLFNRRRLPMLRTAIYAEMVDNNPQRFGNVLRQLADADNLPALIHCTAGKDRTGIGAALLLLALGVPDNIVVADYTLSNLYHSYFRQLVQKTLEPYAWLGVRVDDLYPLLIADAQTMQATLDHIRVKYGSIKSYLFNAAGLDDIVIARLKVKLLEE